MSVRRLLPFAAALFLILPALGPLQASAEDGGEAVPLETAEEELALLEQKVKSSKSINDEIIQALDAVSNGYRNLEEPAKPELKEVPEGASEEEAKAIHAENKALERAYEEQKGKHDRGAEKFRKNAEKQFLKALTLERVQPRSKTNMRDDVNIAAARVLAETGNPDISDDIIKALEKSTFKAKYDVPTLFLDEAFAALGKLGDIKSLEWMIKEFTHANSSPRERVDQLMAAHKAMILFPLEGEKAVPGKVRFALVAAMVKTYASVESQALQSSTDTAILAKKEFWDRIKADVIKAVQYYTGSPTNADGEVLATMQEFQQWFRDNDNPNRLPWKQ